MRIGIVGASTLLGRELADVMGDTALSAAEIVLLDVEGANGQITAVGDEPAVIRQVEKTSFDGMDLCFFAGQPEETKRFWQMARDAGVRVVDLTDSLRAEAGVTVAMPWVNGRDAIDVLTVAVVPSHTLAVMLALVATRCQAFGLKQVAATVLLPASELGQAGLDEMHRQAVSLLSFQSLPKDVFDTQVAFNLLPALGASAKTSTADEAQRIRTDYTKARAGALPELALQVVHAPVFHGYAASMLLVCSEQVVLAQMEDVLRRSGHVEIAASAGEPPTTLNASGQGLVLARVSVEADGRAWVWMTADNLRLRALHAIACGIEMQQLRPVGKMQ